MASDERSAQRNRARLPRFFLNVEGSLHFSDFQLAKAKTEKRNQKAYSIFNL